MAVQDLFREDYIDTSPFESSSLDTGGMGPGLVDYQNYVLGQFQEAGTVDDNLWDRLWSEIEANPLDVPDAVAEQTPIDENYSMLSDEDWEAMNMELNQAEAEADFLRRRGVELEGEGIGLVSPDHPEYQQLSSSIANASGQYRRQRQQEILSKYGLPTLDNPYVQEGDKDQFVFDPDTRDWRRTVDVDDPNPLGQATRAFATGIMTAGIGAAAAPAISGATGLGSTASGAAGGAITSGTGAALSGGDFEDVLGAAAIGAVGGGASGALNGVTPLADVSGSSVAQDALWNAFRQPQVNEEQAREAVPISDVPEGQLGDYVLGDIYAYPRTGSGSAGGGGGSSSGGSSSQEDIEFPEDGQLPEAQGGAGIDNEHQWVYEGEGLFRNVLTGEIEETGTTGGYEVGQVYSRSEESAPQDTGEEESPPQFGSFEDFRRQARTVLNRDTASPRDKGTPSTGSGTAPSDSLGEYDPYEVPSDTTGSGTGSGTGTGTGTGSGSGSGTGAGSGSGEGNDEGSGGGSMVANVLGMGNPVEADRFSGGLTFDPQGLLGRVRPQSIDYVSGLLSRL